MSKFMKFLLSCKRTHPWVLESEGRTAGHRHSTHQSASHGGTEKTIFLPKFLSNWFPIEIRPNIKLAPHLNYLRNQLFVWDSQPANLSPDWFSHYRPPSTAGKRVSQELAEEAVAVRGKSNLRKLELGIAEEEEAGAGRGRSFLNVVVYFREALWMESLVLQLLVALERAFM